MNRKDFFALLVQAFCGAVAMAMVHRMMVHRMCIPRELATAEILGLMRCSTRDRGMMICLGVNSDFAVRTLGIYWF